MTTPDDMPPALKELLEEIKARKPVTVDDLRGPLENLTLTMEEMAKIMEAHAYLLREQQTKHNRLAARVEEMEKRHG